MDALRNSKKIILLAEAILFLFTFFNLILDAPRTVEFILGEGGEERCVMNHNGPLGPWGQEQVRYDS